MAIPFRTTAVISRGEGTGYRFQSEMFAEVREMDAEDRSGRVGDWSDYPVGVLRQLQARGLELPPFTLRVSGTVPLGAGLSSSASVGVASAMAMLSLVEDELSAEEIAVLCRRAENEYVGSPCGIMDQFAITAAKAGHALLLHTRDLTYEQLPMNRGGLAGAQVVVCNSMVKHSVASGEYGVRRRELEAGQAELRREFPELRDLGEATLEQLETARPRMSHESYLRCRHVVSDNGRVVQARQAMFEGDPEALGRLMLAGHASERDDFACSCAEVDFLVETAQALEGCYGARLTGGGFGGCTVNLVAAEAAEGFAAALKRAYRERFGIEAESYACLAVDGAVQANAEREAQA
jgi:galactokinase